MKFQIIFYSISLVFISACCEKDELKTRYDQDGTVILQPHLWRTQTTYNVQVNGYLHSPIVYKDKVLGGIEIKNGVAGFGMFNISDGTKVWELNYPNEYEAFSQFWTYVYKNCLNAVEGHKFYSIDLEKGTYRWVKLIDSYINQWAFGIDSLVFLQIVENYPSLNYPVTTLYCASTENGEIEFVTMPDLGDLPVPNLNHVNISLGGIWRVKPYIDSNSNEIKLLCYYYKQYDLLDDSQISKNYFGIYNYAKKIWELEGIELGDYNFCEGFTPTVVGDKFYHTLSGGVVECRKLFDGSLVWRHEDDYQYSGTGFIITGDLMITQDVNYRQLIAYNINTGSVCWKTPKVGGVGQFQELNGVIYFGSNADGELHAVDVATGKHIWRMQAPDHDKMVDESFLEHVVAILGENGEKGKIIVSSHYYLYCYEAAR